MSSGTFTIVVLGEADPTEVAMRLGRLTVLCLESAEWTDEPLADMVAGHRLIVLQR